MSLATPSPSALPQRASVGPAQTGRGWSRKSLAIAGLAALGAGALVLITLVRLKITGGFLFDFRGDLYAPASAILHGRNPYDPHFLAALAGAMHAGRPVSPGFAVAVYPAPSLVASIPLAFMPVEASGLLFQALMVAAMVGGLRLLGVRDWRCHLAALLSWPFVFGLDVGALGPALVFGAGVAWRLREDLWRPALAIALIVIAKLFPWPLLGWLLVTRRFKTLAVSLLIALILAAAAWSSIGFTGLADYPRMLSDLSFVERGAGSSLVTTLIALGIPGGLSEAIALVVALMIMGVASRRVGRPHGDAQALGLAVIAALIASPIVWPHYFVLLFVPIALVRPRLSVLWLLPLPTVLVPNHNPHSVYALAPWLLLTATVGIALCRDNFTAPASAHERPSRPTHRRSGSGDAVAGLR